MTLNTDDFLNSILQSLSRIDYIKPEDLPNIDLYMDQVTTFMDAQLTASKRRFEDKILTKTMINNYTKNNLLPPPEKKKYSKEHILTLIFIYHFKNILSINDIQEILNPITEKYFGHGQDFQLEDIYREVFQLEKEEVTILQADIARKFQISSETFPNASLKEQQDLQNFAFICMLSFDVYIKKQLIEKMIDLQKEKSEGIPVKQEKPKPAKIKSDKTKQDSSKPLERN
ncbi:DUF1836 domain-containing protein [Lachnospiraceae bacterium ZAX-1]